MTNEMNDELRESIDDPWSKAGDGCLVFLLQLMLCPFEGWVFMLLWRWHLAAHFDAIPEISWGVGFSLMFLRDIMMWNVAKHKIEGSPVERTIVQAFTWVLILGIGWVLSLILGTV